MIPEFLVTEVTHGSAVWLGALWRASWQGGLLLLLVWLVTRGWRRMPLPARIWLWRLVYLKLLLALCVSEVVTLYLLPHRVQQITLASPAAVPAQSSPAPSTPVQGNSPATPTAMPVSSPVTPAANASTPPAMSLQWVNAAVQQSRVYGLLGIIWLCGAGWGGIGLLLAWRQTRCLLRESQPVTDAEILAMLDALTRKMDLLWPPELRACEIPGPLLVRASRPVVLIPTALLILEDREPLRLMLAHELAHIRHHDLRWNWLALLSEILFFFHPLVRWCTREWQLAQEMACDARAIDITEAPGAAYGAMLVNAAASVAQYPGQPVIAVGVSESFRTIHRRLTAMTYRPLVTRSSLLVAIVLIVAVIATFIPWQLAAQQQVQAEVQVQVSPYAEMVFPFTPPLSTYSPVDELGVKQEKLYQLLAADTKLFADETQLPINVVETGVTVHTRAHDAQKAQAQLTAITKAMTKVFNRGSFRTPASDTVFHAVDRALQLQTGQVLMKRLQSVNLAATMKPETNGQIALQITGPKIEEQALSSLLTVGRVELRLLASDIQVSASDKTTQPVLVS